MYITVKYGNNESLVCNPSCAIVNLMKSIKRRTGYGSTTMLLDLSDETGLVKELDMHRYDYANKYLSSHGTYILVEKQLPHGSQDEDAGHDTDGSSPAPPQFNYIPLLDNYGDHFPNFRLHVQMVEKRRKHRANSKSPSPAGVRGTKGKKDKQLARAASRKK
ncbi:hypothetical protein CAPTEDRAFT_227931 [Capitella teleta]|uniref:Uncharacterized protein n=1 Tax=Capitella teleta TaxID=283909 RepID=R7TJP8_CAPTE|nr:hypothetical protein CAPTEDRAFT_227931 [Capitella teleta]|eukprot:ELT94053.1 hypothetical protein CAPTEDRAFT_227931 [Capitella teleta]